MSVTAESLFDLATLVETLVPSSIVDPHTNEGFLQFFSTIHFFGVARNSDASFNVAAVENLFRVFARDVSLIEHYIDQLSARFYFAVNVENTPDRIRFIRNLNIVSEIIASVQRILRRVDINNVRLYAPWRFVLFRLLSRCVSMIDGRIQDGRLPIYQSMMQACGGVDFTPELQYFCEILQKIGTCNRLYYVETCIGDEQFKTLVKMLDRKMQPVRPSFEKKSPLSQSWSSSSESDDDEEVESVVVVSEPIDSKADPIETLLSVQLPNASDGVFEGLSIATYKEKKEEKKDETLNASDAIVAQAKITAAVEPIGSSSLNAKWRSPSLEAAKERHRLMQEEKKKRKRFPYRRIKKTTNASAAVDKLVENVPDNAAKDTPKKTSTPPKTPTPPATPPKTPTPPVTPPPLATSSPTTPEKKKKRDRYNKMWLKK